MRHITTVQQYATQTCIYRLHAVNATSECMGVNNVIEPLKSIQATEQKFLVF